LGLSIGGSLFFQKENPVEFHYRTGFLF